MFKNKKILLNAFLVALFISIFNFSIKYFELSIVLSSIVFFVTTFTVIIINLYYSKPSKKENYNISDFSENTSPGIFILEYPFNPKNVVYLNPSFSKMLGLGLSELLNKEFLEEKYWSNLEFRTLLFEQLQSKESIDSLELPLKKQDGSNLWVRLSCRVIDFDKHKRLQGSIHDISDKKKFEREQRKFYERLSAENRHQTKELVVQSSQIQEIQRLSIHGLSKITEYRDPETGNHIERMSEYARELTKALSSIDKYKDYITKLYIDEIFISAPLHDIGKVGIEDNVLKKPGKLTKDEFHLMKYHSIFGGDTLKELEKKLSFQSFFTLGKEIAYNHHQKWDGTGYPNVSPDGKTYTLGVEGHKPLAGNDIPLSARIIALADVYDALTSKRCYKDAMTHEKAEEIILEGKGSHFDPDIIDAFMLCKDRFITIKSTYVDP